MMICRKAHLNLLFRTFLYGQILRKLVFAKKGDLRRLDILFKFATFILAQDKYFYDAVGIIGHIVLSPVLHRDQPVGSDDASRLLPDLLVGIRCDRLIHVAPAARQ